MEGPVNLATPTINRDSILEILVGDIMYYINKRTLYEIYIDGH